MTSQCRLHLDGIGPVSIAHSRRARRLRITVRPSGVRVSVPYRIALREGRDFALAHRDWIGQHVKRLELRLRAQADAAQTLPTLSERSARDMIHARLSELSAHYDLPYARVNIRRQKTRWGSCSGSGAISLNIALARLPRELMDYVILHELLHTRIKGHGPLFWKALERLNTEALDHRRRLRSYSPEML